ncbi:MAG: glycosyltransferase [Deltaproteobacteria bacterium]|nr:glycosyltransferase [Deltaproteobacteria bacterium]MBW2309266.1 glycosyltransferase [Deltaproteobacteria bacterium]
MGEYDVMVGIPSYNEADTIAYVTRMASLGIQKYFSQYRSIIVNVDNNSQDNTRDAFLRVETSVEKHCITTPDGVRGKGNNFWNLFNFVMESGARIVLVLDADLKSVTPEWVERLVRPIEQGYQYICPLYTRHPFDAAITNHMCYPLIFGLLGVDIRHPNGGDFAFSREMCSYWLDRRWEESTRQHGIDIFMTLHAILGGFRIAQAGLGTKVHRARIPNLGITFEQAIHTLFSILVETREQWVHRSTGDLTTPFKFGQEEPCMPHEPQVDLRDLKSKTRAEYFKYRDLLRAYLNDHAFNKIDRMIYMDYFEVDTMFWTQVLYMLLHRFERESEQGRKEIIEIMKPLYYSRALTFDYQTWRHDFAYSEECVREQALAFASQRPYLLGLYSRDHI